MVQRGQEMAPRVNIFPGERVGQGAHFGLSYLDELIVLCDLCVMFLLVGAPLFILVFGEGCGVTFLAFYLLAGTSKFR
jgi:hypothetical protein